MNSKTEREPERFAVRFLENHGAVLETHENRYEALLPESLCRLLDAPEHIYIERQTDPGVDAAPKTGADNVFSAGYGSPLLEKTARAACGSLPLLACRLRFDYLKTRGFDKLIKRDLTFHGAGGVVESHAEIRTEYLYLTCRWLAQSDEQKEGLVDLMFHLETGAHISEMPGMLSTAAMEFITGKPTLTKNNDRLDRIMERAERTIRTNISHELGRFQKSMTRRFRRDVANLEEYYAGLKMEMEASLKRPGLSKKLVDERKEKIALIPDEMARKKDDLFNKYSIRVKVAPCAAMLIRAPAVKILYRAVIGRENKTLSLIYNPVTKSMDPLVCAGCGASSPSVHFCTNLHMLCPACDRGCPVC